MNQRKGARRMADIPPEILDAISEGRMATVNLVEFLAADLQRLLPAVASHIGLDTGSAAIRQTITRIPTIAPMQRHWAIARFLFTEIAGNATACRELAAHTSDIARQWAALFAGLRPDLSLSERLAAARPFATDTHFAVREMAWLAVRDAVAVDALAAIDLLSPWVSDPDPNLRRFASELTRPRGVWCRHLEILRQNPEPGLRLLEPLRADPARYVQDSVANWLNDASRDHPDWTRSITARWLAESQTVATRHICRRACRTLDKPSGRRG